MFIIRRNIIRNMSVFTQNFNPLTGKSEWEIQDEDYDYHQEIARSSFADMLHDTERNKKYFLGIKAAIEKMHLLNKKANVLDIGTGTGLLSMMAVQCGADSVTAIEGFLPVANCAKKIIEANGFAEKIKIIPKCSLDVTVGDNADMENRANILVTEIFDTELIGEGAIKTFAHAHRELLETDCIVVPTSGKMYAQVVESPLANNWRKIKSIVDTDDGLPIVQIPKAIQECIGTSAVHDIQLNQFPVTHFKTFIPPTVIFNFDWSGKTEIHKTRSKIHVSKSKCTGTAHVVFVWWDLNMDIDGKVILSCAPYWAHPDTKDLSKTSDLPLKDVTPWRDHWMQAVYFLPDEVKISNGNDLKLICCHDEYSLWFNLKVNEEPTDNDYQKPTCHCGVHFILSRTRIGQMNDSTRNKKYLAALKNKIDSNTVCLTLSDGSILGILAAKMGAKQVYCIETSCLFLSSLQKIMTENNVTDKVKYFKSVEEFYKEQTLATNLVIAEPNFLYSLLPWDNFHFIYLMKKILPKKLPQNVEIMPKKVIIYGIGVKFLNLHKIKKSLVNLEGFEMSHFDEMIKDSSDRADSKVEPQPLWEYPCYAMTNPVSMFELDIASYDITLPRMTRVESCPKPCTINGIALWVDWYLDDSLRNIISSGPIEPTQLNQEIRWDMHTKQGVYFFENSLEIQDGDKLSFTTNCNEDKIDFRFELCKKIEKN